MNVAHPPPSIARAEPHVSTALSQAAGRSISAIDLRILRQLQANARMTNVELAEKVGLSPSPCWRRVRALEERGVIARYSAVIDPAALGLSVEAMVNVTLEKQAAPDRKCFEEQVLARPEVVDVHLVSGDADYLMRVLAQDTKALGRVVDSLAAIKGVRTLRCQIMLSSVRRIMPCAVPLPSTAVALLPI
jgi:DNA-binding Lrp family transcriptional regulator